MVTQSFNFPYFVNYLFGETVTNPYVQLPTYRQQNIMLNWIRTGILSQPQRLNTLKFQNYNNGSNYNFYSASVTYSISNRINGGLAYNNVIFESVTQSIITGTFSVNDWLEVLPSNIGYQERSSMLDSRIVFEWYLNRYFYTTFRQPNFTDTSKSDIYISDNTPNQQSFFIGTNDNNSGFVGVNESTIGGPGTTKVWIGPSQSLYNPVGGNFIINITATAFAGIPGVSNTISLSASSNPTQSGYLYIRSVADWINYQGMVYTINVY